MFHLGARYVKCLPVEDLPTAWSAAELQTLAGTTLAPAVDSKLRSLRREYGRFCESVQGTHWSRVVLEQLDFDDWLIVDAMYRSRVLDLPHHGHCMVPCIDLANHARGEMAIAVYGEDPEHNATLQLRVGKTLKAGQEITITYGDEKGACEMLFSYGFLEQGMQTAETLFLSLAIPDSDSSRSGKMEIAGCAPGFKLIDTDDGEIDWSGDFIWLACVGFGDGLCFKLATTTDGCHETQCFFNEHELVGGAAQLRALLAQTDLWEVYHLRALTILQQRVFEQLLALDGTQEVMEAQSHGEDTDVRSRPYQLCMQLRKLEFELLNTAYEQFEREVSQSAFVLSPADMQPTRYQCMDSLLFHEAIEGCL